MALSDQMWILMIMAGAIVLLALIALIMFTPPRPTIPSEGPIQVSIAPFKDLTPDPAHAGLGDRLAHDFANALNQYGRIETVLGDEPMRFALKGKVQRKGELLTARMTVTSGGRFFWSRSFVAKDTETETAAANAAGHLARRMKLVLK